VLSHQLGQAVFVNGRLTSLDHADLFGVDVAKGDQVTERRQARPRHESNVSGPDYTDTRKTAHGVYASCSMGIDVDVCPLGRLARPSGRADFAMAYIVSGDSW